MPPKTRITKDSIIQAGVQIVRSNGAEALNARSISTFLDCSTQPVFSNFSSMQELKLAVVDAACELYKEYLQKEIASGLYPPYKSSGIAYIRFAKEEKELFRLLFMRDRSAEIIPASNELDRQMEAFIHESTGLGDKETKLLHLETWAFVHGIAVMFATGYFDLEWELVSKMLTDAFLGLRKQFEKE